MGHGRAKGRRATYQDLLAAPPHEIAELIDGALVLSPRPAGPHRSVHTTVHTTLIGDIEPAFARGPYDAW